MRLSINYTNGSGFTVSADDPDDLETLYALALKTLWGKNAAVMTLDEADKWLGWEKRR